MGTTGLIYVAIVAAWAAYLVPMMLKRNDEANRRRSVAAYSSSEARVLSRSADGRGRYSVRAPSATAIAGPAADLVDGSAPTAAGGDADGSPVVSGVSPGPPAYRFVPNRARRVAAMRRRRVLSILTLSLLTTTALAGLGMLLWWSLTIPAGLIAGFVVLTRVQLRRQSRERAALAEERRTRRERRHDRGPATAPPAPSPDREPTIEVRLPVAPQPLVPRVRPSTPTSASSEGLWDPVPVTLPTYVHKEKAPDRTVRTINLTGPDVYSSARAVEPEPESAPIVLDEEPTPEAEPEPEIRRAVGD